MFSGEEIIVYFSGTYIGHYGIEMITESLKNNSTLFNLVLNGDNQKNQNCGSFTIIIKIKMKSYRKLDYLARCQIDIWRTERQQYIGVSWYREWRLEQRRKKKMNETTTMNEQETPLGMKEQWWLANYWKQTRLWQP